MLYRFLPVTLFVLELGTVYGMTAVASAYMQPIVPTEPATQVERREGRIVVVPSKKQEVDQVVSVDEIDADIDEKESHQKLARVRRAEGVADAEGLLASLMKEKDTVVPVASVASPKKSVAETKVFKVPFYSQFADISSPSWQKVGCGIASLSMIIDYYSDEQVSVDTLLDRGIKSGAYISSAGWSHAGLIGLSKSYGLDGESVSLADLSMENAFNRLEKELAEGPVMVSVHYTFEPTNPIPHLVVIDGVRDGKVYYNDPAEKAGGGSISIDKFKGAWKKRYISIRPT